MNILFFRWGAYTELDLIDELNKGGIRVDTIVYSGVDKYHDDTFEKGVLEKISNNTYDFFFSVNYFPVVANICYKAGLKYVSWSYDAPLNVINIEETLGLPTNYVFLFDRDQFLKYRNMGFDNIYHLPLAAPVKRYDTCNRPELVAKYRSDISFVGNLYSDVLGAYIAPLSDYLKGFINGLCNSQAQIYGSYILDELINDKLIASINKEYLLENPDTDIRMTKEALSFAMASWITRQERFKLLGILARQHKLTYYSKEKNEILNNAIYAGTCDYYKEMPYVFKNSKINLNITLKILSSGIPLRALDIMACKGFLLSNYQVELAEYFTDGKEVILYESIEDAYEKVAYYLKHDDEREAIANNGYAKVCNEYTYALRIGDIVKIIGG